MKSLYSGLVAGRFANVTDPLGALRLYAFTNAGTTSANDSAFVASLPSVDGTGGITASVFTSTASVFSGAGVSTFPVVSCVLSILMSLSVVGATALGIVNIFAICAGSVEKNSCHDVDHNTARHAHTTISNPNTLEIILFHVALIPCVTAAISQYATHAATSPSAIFPYWSPFSSTYAISPAMTARNDIAQK